MLPATTNPGQALIITPRMAVGNQCRPSATRLHPPKDQNLSDPTDARFWATGRFAWGKSLRMIGTGGNSVGLVVNHPQLRLSGRGNSSEPLTLSPPL